METLMTPPANVKIGSVLSCGPLFGFPGGDELTAMAITIDKNHVEYELSYKGAYVATMVYNFSGGGSWALK